ncbi:MAG: PorV/PorQ family protein [Bacteroidales bacterium]|nr:PorV/PorQ family protein [Bacteroidales bacterium]MBP5645045.1 PorV/PorQ family protein [Bacteroidales bacterium]
MKKIFRIFTVVALVALLATQSAWAGNDNRRGTAGATELLINPWARSTGWGSVSVANVRGLESFYSNIAGLCFLQGVGFNYTNTFLYGGKTGLNSGGSINALALGVRISEQGVLGVSLNSFSFGDIPITKEGSPEPNNGSFSPTLMNINVAYAHSFTNTIHGGVNIKVISESTDNITGTGFSVDAGIQYVTGANDELKFGISLKNWGPAMSFEGTGMSFTFVNNAGNNMTAEYRSGEMELPTCLNIGLSYDFLFETWQQRLTIAGAFTSNAFLKDNITLGMEYSMFDIFSLRCGYVWQKNIFSDTDRTTANTGFCAGGSVDIPLNKKDEESNMGLSIDYSYRMASPLKGTHSIGASFRF